jgi:(R,R)-butanediol dehydrogenase / meso-butanediol dehydrogenase / diacetyl reductase
MRAAVYHGAGDVRIESVPEPGHPGSGELLLAVIRNGICGSDAGEFQHGPRMVPVRERHPNSAHGGPTILGHEFVGRVVEIGPGVTGFEAGQRVACGAGVSCGACEWCRAGRTNLCARYYTIGLQRHGGLAELVRAPAAICVAVPDDCSDDAAAMAQPLAVALHALNRSAVDGGSSLAVIGVGGMGSFIVGAAVRRSTSDVLAVDIDEGRLEIARRLGARVAVDARSADVGHAVRAATGGEGADVVVEVSGTWEGLAQGLRAVRRGGRVVVVGLQAAPPVVDLFDLSLREVDLVTTVAHVCRTDLPEAIDMLATTPLASLVIDRVIPLDRLVPDGILALTERRARGKILVDPRLGSAGASS